MTWSLAIGNLTTPIIHIPDEGIEVLMPSVKQVTYKWCMWCGDTLSEKRANNGAIYCSTGCLRHATYVREKQKSIPHFVSTYKPKELGVKTCPYCKTEFVAKDARQEYCGHGCRNRFHSEERSRKKLEAAMAKRVGKLCIHCKNPLPAKPHGLVKYCSTTCQANERTKQRKARLAK